MERFGCSGNLQTNAFALQVQIGNHCVKFSLAKLLNRLGKALDADNFILLLLQNGLKREQDSRLIVHHKDGWFSRSCHRGCPTLPITDVSPRTRVAPNHPKKPASAAIEGSTWK